MKKIINTAAVILVLLVSPLFGQDDTEDLYDDILSGLESTNPEVQNHAITFITTKSPEKLVPGIVEIILESDDPGIREGALKALKAYPPEAIFDSWFQILNETDSFMIKKEAIEFLSGTNSPRLVKPIAEQLKSPFNIVRKAAAEALKTIGDDRMYPLILSMARSENPVYRIYAVEAMFYLYDRRFHDVLLELLNDPNKSVRIYVLDSLLINKLDEVLPKIRDIAQNDSNDEVRIKAIEVIGDFDDSKSLYVIHKTLSDYNRNVRMASVETIHKIKSSSSVYALSEQLYNEDQDDIKKRIIETGILLGNLGKLDGIERVILTDKNPDLRIFAAYAVGAVQDSGAIDILLRGLQDQDMYVRAEICHSLGFFKRDEVLTGLLKIVKGDPERYVRTAALYSIERLKRRDSIVPLFDIFSNEEDPIFREILRLTLRQLMNMYI